MSVAVTDFAPAWRAVMAWIPDPEPMSRTLMPLRGRVLEHDRELASWLNVLDMSRTNFLTCSARR